MKTIKTSIATSGGLLYLKATIWALVTVFATITLILLLFSAILLISGTLPHDYLQWLDIAACAAGSFTAGYISARITKHNALLSGFLSGSTIFAILLLSGFICGNSLSYITIIKFSAIMLTSLAGAVKGVNKKDKLIIK